MQRASRASRTFLRLLHSSHAGTPNAGGTVSLEAVRHACAALALSASVTGSASALGPAWRHPFGSAYLLRQISTSTSSRQQAKQQDAKQTQQQSVDSLEITEETFSAITDKIPQKPVGIVEGTSYTLLILGAFTVLAFFLYNFVADFILEPLAIQCYNHALERLKLDPRITVRLGEDLRAWGRDSSSRVARQQIPHQVYKDAEGVEHVRLQFHIRGPGGSGLVNADMFKDSVTKEWQYSYLVVDVASAGARSTQRLNIVSPQ